MKTKLLLSLTLLAALVCAAADLRLASIFSDDMILQRGMAVPVWGTATPGDTIEVSFAGQTAKATAGKDGRWEAMLQPLTASKENRVMRVKRTNDGATVEIRNVLVGEVWLCSGQSNMEFRMVQSAGAQEEFARCENPLIRFADVKEHRWRQRPSTDYPMMWLRVNSKTLPAFSAVGYYFGKELFEKLDVPIGLVGSNWGGTKIEPWLTPEGLATVPALAELKKDAFARMPNTPEQNMYVEQVRTEYGNWLKAFETAVAEGTELPPPPQYPARLMPYTGLHQPTVIHNGMTSNVVPYAMRGAIWYQGCSNRGDTLYTEKMHALFNGYKAIFRNPDFKLYFVQLAPFRYWGSFRNVMLPEMWEQQQRFNDETGDEVGMAVINDVGNLKDIHPTDKVTPGHRLALLALKYTYGFKNLKADSPTPASIARSGNTVTLSFKNAETLSFRGTPQFEICDESLQYRPAQATIVNGNSIKLQADGVDKPANVRFMWDQGCEASVFNEAGLPMGAFRLNTVLDADQELRQLRQEWQSVADFTISPIRYSFRAQPKALQPFKRVTYLVIATTKQPEEVLWVKASFDTDGLTAEQLLPPPVNVGRFLQRQVKNLSVTGNVPTLRRGNFPNGCIEFFGTNYDKQNTAKIPGASDTVYDFGDRPANGGGYGCFQVHNIDAKQTVFGYSNFSRDMNNADFGIGPAPEGLQPDWTWSKSLQKFKSVNFYVFVK